MLNLKDKKRFSIYICVCKPCIIILLLFLTNILIAQVNQPIIPIPQNINPQNINSKVDKNDQNLAPHNTQSPQNITEPLLPLPPQTSRSNQSSSPKGPKNYDRQTQIYKDNQNSNLIIPLPNSRQQSKEEELNNINLNEYRVNSNQSQQSISTTSLINEVNSSNNLAPTNIDATNTIENIQNNNQALPYFPKDTSSAIFMVMKTWECENYDVKTLINHAIKVYSEESEDQFVQKGLDNIPSYNVTLNEEDITLDELLDIIAQKGNIDWGVDVKNKIIYFYTQQNKQ